MSHTVKYSSKLAVAALFACLSLTPATFTYAAKPNSPIVVVSQATTDQVVDEIRLTGSVSSPQVSRLSTEVNGLVKTIHVEEGSRVKAGDLLLTLDPEMAALTLQAAEASTRKASEELADARRRLKDGERLVKKKTLSDNEFKSLQAEVNIANATLQRYRAEQRLQQIRLQRHELLAPFAGVISKKLIESGEWVQTGDPVLELVADTGLRIDFQVPQKEYPRIRIDSEIRLSLDALPGETIAGKVQTVIPYSDEDTRTFLLRVLLEKGNPAIVPGMSASGTLQLDTGNNSIVVSRDAVLRYPDGRIAVWIVQQTGDQHTVRERIVSIGSSFENQVAILDGLQVGDLVVIEGNESLRDGQTVTVQQP